MSQTAPREYKPVPVAEAARLGSAFDKQAVIIIGIDVPFDRVHAATFGDTAPLKIRSHELALKFVETAGAIPEAGVYSEDYRRNFSAALFAEARDLMNAMVASATGPPKLVGMMEDWLRRAHDHQAAQASKRRHQ